MELMHSHIGVRVRDLQRSADFYTSLGFSEVDGDGYESYCLSGPEINTLLETEGVQLTGRFFRHGNLMIELLEFAGPALQFGARPIYENGFTHLSFAVDNLEEVRKQIAALGGDERSHTRTSISGNNVCMCYDPDGNRIELLERPPG